MSIDITNRNVIKQSHSLILSQYELSEVSLNLLFTILTELTNETKDFEEAEVKIVELHRKMGFEIKRASYDKIAKELMSNPIKIMGENNTVNYFNWCSKFSFNTKEGWIKMEIHKDLKYHLTSLTSHFGISYLNELLKIKSLYGKRLYMILKQYLKLGKMEISIIELRRIFNLEKKFPLYGDLKRRVLLTAISHIENSSNLKISFEEIKVGRKVEKIKFIMKSSTKNNLKTVQEDSVQSWLEDKNQDIIDCEVE